MRPVSILASLIFVLSSALPAHALERCRASDGDTIRCGAERVRIIGLDAPEMRARCPAELRQARAARDRLAVLVAGGVLLEPHGRDKYRRLLAVVRDRQGRDIAAVMIREGLARPYDGRGRRQGWCEPGLR